MKPIAKAGLVCCSDGEPDRRKEQHGALRRVLEKRGIEPVFSPYIYARQGGAAGTAAERAEAVSRFFRDGSVDAVFDLSGGDMANEILDGLDYEAIARSHARFWGYSDLTTVINGIYAVTGKDSVLYQVKNLILDQGEEQQKAFFSEGSRELFDLPVRFLRGSHMEGVVVGGNIRCLLKLAGTRYFPDMEGKLLLLEANSGQVPQMITYLSQLSQLGVFEKISGVLLGTFSQMEREKLGPAMEELVLARVPERVPVAKTDKIGHGTDARAIRIGREYSFG